MRKTPETTTSGLTATDKSELMRRLAALNELNSRSFLLGGADRIKVEAVLRRIQARLNPEPPSVMIAAADAVLGQYVPNASWVSDEVRTEVMRAVG